MNYFKIIPKEYKFLLGGICLFLIGLQLVWVSLDIGMCFFGIQCPDTSGLFMLGIISVITGIIIFLIGLIKGVIKFIKRHHNQLEE